MCLFEEGGRKVEEGWLWSEEVCVSVSEDGRGEGRREREGAREKERDRQKEKVRQAGRQPDREQHTHTQRGGTSSSNASSKIWTFFLLYSCSRFRFSSSRFCSRSSSCSPRHHPPLSSSLRMLPSLPCLPCLSPARC